MNLMHRSYADVEGDFKRLSRFIVSHNQHLQTHSTWSLGQFVDWKYGLYEDKQAIANFWDKNAQLWFDGFGDLAGVAISERGDAGFAILTAEGYRWLFEQILDWLLENWGTRNSRLSTEITEHQRREIVILERLGFRPTSALYTQRFDLTVKSAQCYPLEQGFTIVDMLTHPDYRAQRVLRADAFSGTNALTEDELRRQLEFYNTIHAGPIYHPQCDLCVMAEDGRFVAGCEALIDARNVQADIERVCTHSQFRNRGFARAVIGECLCRLRDMGLRSASITGYSPEAIALYGSLGAVDRMQWLIYEMAMH